MRNSLPVAVIVIFAILAGQTAVWGQGVNRSVSSGMFGPRTLGGGITAGTRSFGRDAFSQGSSIGSRGSLGSTGRVGAMSSTSPASGGDQRPGQFVGTSSSDIRDFMSAMGAGRNVERGSRSGLSSRGPSRPGDANRRGGAGRGGRNRVNVRASLHVAFDYPSTMPDQVGTAMARRLEQSKGIQALSAMEVRVLDGTATLRGVVATQRDRDLAGRLARLEAGIWHVKNELVVAQVPAEPQRPAAEERPAAEKPVGDSSARPTGSENSATELPAGLVAPSNLPAPPPDAGSSGAD